MAENAGALLEFAAWLRVGVDRRWVSDVVCAMHDGVPMTFDEQTALDDGDDPCTPAIRVWHEQIQ